MAMMSCMPPATAYRDSMEGETTVCTEVACAYDTFVRVALFENAARSRWEFHQKPSIGARSIASKYRDRKMVVVVTRLCAR